MFRKKKKPKTRRAARERKRVDPATLARRRKIKHFTLGLMVSATVALGLILGLALLREQMAPPISEVVLVDVPEWLDDSAAEQIRQAALEVVRDNAGDDRLAQKVAKKLAENIWVKGIAPAGVVSNYDNRNLTIRCEYRRPLAVVSGPGVLVRVDREALVLPGRFLRSGVPAGKYREIVGVKSDPPEAGQMWNAPDLLAGVDLLRLIDDRPFAREITAVDVSNYRGRQNVARPHIVMTTDQQSRINWGKAIGMEGRIEAHYKTKLQNLEGLFLRYGSLNKLVYADLRGQKVGVKEREGE